MKKKFSLIMIIMSLLIAMQALPSMAEPTNLSADNIRYSTKTQKAFATGNVVITRGTAVLRGDTGEGNIEKSIFQVKGNVTGEFKEHNATLKAGLVKYTKQGEDGIVEAFERVHLTREPSDRLNAAYIKWKTGSQDYTARGNVDGILSGKYINADEAGREGDKFWGINVRRYEDTVQKIAVAGKRVDGVLKDELILTLTAVGSVKIDTIDQQGLKTVITGEKLVYEKELGTAVITGDPKAVRSDGKRLKADKLVLHEGTNDIEAVGNSNVFFEVEEKPADESAPAKKSGKKNKK